MRRLPPPGRWWLLAALTVSASLAQSDAPVRDDARLREGVARYHYYQQDYLPALTELMVARARNPGSTAERAAVLEGAIRLAFGMPDSAESRFRTALDEQPAQRAAAYFYLGKLHYLRGDWAGATAAWAHLDGALSAELAREQRALKWQMALRRGERPEIQTEKLWKQLDHWAPSIFYNLGGAHARNGEGERARHYYRALTEEAPRRHWSDEEYWAWVDRAHTAVGFTHLLEGDYPRAEAAFSKVRLEQSGANRALLGYGWAAAERGDYREALRPWQALGKRSLTQSSVHEVLLAIPHAYEQLGAEAAALSAYDRAEGLLQGELNRVAQLQETLTGERLRQYFQAGTTTDGQAGAATDGTAPTRSGQLLSGQARENWLSLTRATVAFSHDDYLDEWVNRSQFQGRVQALSDLEEQRQHLAQWRPKLNHYDQLLRDKQQLREQRGAQIERRALLARADSLREQRQPLARRLQAIEAERDYLALADEEARSLNAMVDRALAAAERLEAAGEDIGDSREQLRRYRGILRWRAAQNFPDNLWRAQKQLNGLGAALTTLDERQQRLRSIIAENPDIRPSLDRLAQLDGRIDAQLQALDTAIDRRADTLAEELQAHLDEHRQRLNHYLARTRLAAARVQDEALHRQRGNGRESAP